MTDREVGLVIEAATEHVEVLVRAGDGRTLAHLVEDVGHGHTRRLAPMVGAALDRAGVKALDLGWVGVDLGPGSFTGVRVGVATGEALALAAGAILYGASSLASLALACGARGALVVPLVPAGRRDLYAGFFRADPRGGVSLLAAPRVGPMSEVLAATAEAVAIAGVKAVRFIGPGVAREREPLERAHPASTEPEFRFEGLSALDLASASLCALGAMAGLPDGREGVAPCYVRPAQAEERVRHLATAFDPVTLRAMEDRDLARIAEVERQVFSDPWPEPFFRGELAQPGIHARVAEFGGELAGYSMAWLGEGAGHLGNLAVVPGRRRRGIARRLVRDLLERALAAGADPLTLEVRASNFAAQGLYRAHGFRLAGLRRGYYRDTGEDALIMEWRRPAVPGPGRAESKTKEARSLP